MDFTTIYHPVRKQFGLSCNEYCVADMIFWLSSNPEAPVPGWCNASNGYLAEHMVLTRQSIITITQKLESLGLIEKNGDLKRTSKIWYKAVTGCKESLQGVKKVDTPTLSRKFTPCQKSLQEGVKKLDTDIYIDIQKEEVVDVVVETGEVKIEPLETKTTAIPPVAATPPDDLIEVLTQHEQNLKNNSEFVRGTARALGVKTADGQYDIERIRTLIGRFFAEQIVAENQRARVWSEAKRHCYSWIRIQIEKQPSPNERSNQSRFEPSGKANPRPAKRLAIVTDEQLLARMQEREKGG
ncbi:hypothetical protein GCM10028803_00090 [Larkinella knui]|uniref:Helix-turn-helix domain-containing protein n=1 Tax=Larkinella knui TaxID=2025310 RepID=A0A3P1CJD0_9BACT|nr:helix-turn-helix domain-containing protein [Larkinella knui]RRB13417.1 helix-turn-helix domain-containing protein [Larkinella knui]